MLALPLTHASNSGAHLQPQSIVSRSSTQASRFCSQGRQHLVPLFQLGRSHRLMHLFCPLRKRSCSLIPWCFGSSPSLQGCVTVHSGSNCCSLAPLCCPLLSSDHVLCSCHLEMTQGSLPLIQPILPYPVCATGQLLLLLAITVSLLGTSPSWPTSLAHSLIFLRVTPSRGSLLAVLPVSLVVAPCPVHAGGNLSGGMMRAITLLLLATTLGVTFVTLVRMRIRLVSASCANRSTAQ